MSESTTDLLDGGGVAADLIRTIDWSKTTLGPISAWPRSLISLLNLMLHSRHPMFLWWGPELIQFYNDAYIPNFGYGQHLTAMGESGPESQCEIWPDIWPEIEKVMKHAEATCRARMGKPSF